jgi:hypothetical protein
MSASFVHFLWLFDPVLFFWQSGAAMLQRVCGRRHERRGDAPVSVCMKTARGN